MRCWYWKRACATQASLTRCTIIHAGLELQISRRLCPRQQRLMMSRPGESGDGHDLILDLSSPQTWPMAPGPWPAGLEFVYQICHVLKYGLQPQTPSERFVRQKRGWSGRSAVCAGFLRVWMFSSVCCPTHFFISLYQCNCLCSALCVLGYNDLPLDGRHCHQCSA